MNSTDKDTPACRDIKIYPAERRIAHIVDGKEHEIQFTAMEFNFIYFMVSNKGRVFTRDQLLSKVWDYQYMGDTRAVDDLVKRIRKKLDAAKTDFAIETVWGYGYKVTDAIPTEE
jgi:DNA-binding response OmpR family regulator